MNEFAAALIAGGRSRRMGTDKAFLDWRGRMLWQHQLEKLRALNPSQLLLSCRSDQPFPAQPDIFFPVYDEWPDSGPLGGVASCMRVCDAPLLVVLGIDLPMLSAEFLRWLLTECTAECGAVIAQEGGYFEPLAAVYPLTLLALAEEQLAAGRLTMQGFIRHGMDRGLMRVASGPRKAEWFTNLNRPADLSPPA